MIDEFSFLVGAMTPIVIYIWLQWLDRLGLFDVENWRKQKE